MWSVVLHLDTAVDGDAVGNLTASYTDEELFVEPLTVSFRTAIKTDYAEIKKQCDEALAKETEKRTVAAKIAGQLESFLNGGK